MCVRQTLGNKASVGIRLTSLRQPHPTSSNKHSLDTVTLLYGVASKMPRFVKDQLKITSKKASATLRKETPDHSIDKELAKSCNYLLVSRETKAFARMNSKGDTWKVKGGNNSQD